MFDAFLKSKFYSKCKTAIKLTRKRIEMIKRKRKAIEKFLKKDIADLLKNDLDINAYGRAEGLLIELNMSACYEFVAQFCTYLLHQVSLMDKQRDCPEECREAVPSLMYAAARFADLPELRELRAIFFEKYGNSLDANINQEFVEKLKARPPTKEMKIQLLQDIALESGKSWDSKVLEQKLYVPPSSKSGLPEDTNGEINTVSKFKYEPFNKINKKDAENNKRGSSAPSSPRRMKDLSSYRTRKTNEDRQKLQENENNAIHAGDTKKVVAGFSQNERRNELNSEREVHKTELDEKKPFQSKISSPPPYHRRSSSEVAHEGDVENMPNKDIQGKYYNKTEHQNKSMSGKNGQEGKNDEIKYYQRKFAPVSSRPKKLSGYQDEHLANENNAGHGENSEKTSGRKIKNMLNPERNEHEGKSDVKQQFQSKFAPPAPYTRPNAETSLSEEKTQQQDVSVDNAKPNPKSVRSVRSRRSMAPPNEGKIMKSDDPLDATKQELAAKPSHKNMNIDEDERDIDEVLLHYCRKDSPRSGRGLQTRSRDGPSTRREERHLRAS